MSIFYAKAHACPFLLINFFGFLFNYWNRSNESIIKYTIMQ